MYYELHGSGGDFVGVPASQLAVFPGTTHFFGLAKTPVVVVALEAANVPMKRLPAVVYGGNQAAARWPAWRLYRVVQAGGSGRSRVQTATRPFSVLRWLQTCWCSGSGAVANSPPRLVNRKIRAASPHR